MPFAVVAAIVGIGEPVTVPRLLDGEGRVAGDSDGETVEELFSKGVAYAYGGGGAGVALSDGVEEIDGDSIGGDSIGEDSTGEDSAGRDALDGDAIGVDEAGEIEEVAMAADSVQAPPGGRSAQQP